MEKLWAMELRVYSKEDGSILRRYAPTYHPDRQTAESVMVDLSLKLAGDEYIAGFIKHPTYGRFFLDPSMWSSIIWGRRMTF